MATLTYKKEKIKENENRLKYKSYVKSKKKKLFLLFYCVQFYKWYQNNFLKGMTTLYFIRLHKNMRNEY